MGGRSLARVCAMAWGTKPVMITLGCPGLSDHDVAAAQVASVRGLFEDVVGDELAHNRRGC